MKAMHGTLYLFICLSTVSVWLWTPPTAHSTNTAPSRTRSARSTSTVKSTWPRVQGHMIMGVRIISYSNIFIIFNFEIQRCFNIMNWNKLFWWKLNMYMSACFYTWYWSCGTLYSEFIQKTKHTNQGLFKDFPTPNLFLSRAILFLFIMI